MELKHLMEQSVLLGLKQKAKEHALKLGLQRNTVFVDAPDKLKDDCAHVPYFQFTALHVDWVLGLINQVFEEFDRLGLKDDDLPG
jgi:hypothetical protein